MADRFTFTGLSQLGYFQYADLDTGGMLVAEPGSDYAIRAINPSDPVPPPDGRWQPVSEPPEAPPPWTPPPVATVTASQPETASDDPETGENA